MKANQLAWAILLLAAPVALGQNFTTLHAFTGGTNGANPCAGLLLSGGTLYGTAGGPYLVGAPFGTPSGYGTVFSINTNGTGFATLHSFTGLTDGATPQADLILSGSTLYGTTANGGPYSFVVHGAPGGTPNGYGTVFAISTNGTGFTVVHGFTNNPDGASPCGRLVLNGSTLYGTTAKGGSNGYGMVFSVNTDGTAFSNLYSFSVLVSGTNSDGVNPYAGLVLLGTTLYGTAANGGSGGHGTVFSLNTNGTGFTTLHSFTAGSDGANPRAALLLSSGTLYGTAQGGGSGYGVVFKLNTDGNGFTNIYIFHGNDGASPDSSLITYDDTLYGTTALGGAGSGTVFTVNTNGTEFAGVCNFGGSDGSSPQANLVLFGSTLFGTLSQGGSQADGTLFSLSLIPTVTVTPVSQTNYVGSSVTFTAFAVPFSVSYQWQKNHANLVDGRNVSGSAGTTLTLANISDADSASYSVIVSNSFGSAFSSNALLTVSDLPFIATQPLSQIIGIGSNVNFTATAYGASPLVFQWYYGDSPVGSPTTGTNNSSYTLTDVQTNESGNYSVHVFNGSGGAASSNGVLTVQAFPPSIGTQPTNQTVLIGGSASFNVSVSGGTAPFFYQWRLNSSNILDATNASYAIQSVGTNNAGNYSVVITNSAGSVTSSNAVLMVIVPPSLTLQFLAGYPLLNLNGMLSSNFVVQYSTNLATTNWINLLSLSNLSSNPYQFLDSGGQGQPARFYRTLMQ